MKDDFEEKINNLALKAIEEFARMQAVS